MLSPRRSLDISVLHAELDVKDAEIGMLRARLSLGAREGAGVPPPSPTTVPILVSSGSRRGSALKRLVTYGVNSNAASSPEPAEPAIREPATAGYEECCASGRASLRGADMALRLVRLRDWLRRARRRTMHALQSLVSPSAPKASGGHRAHYVPASFRPERDLVLSASDLAPIKHAPFCCGFCHGGCAIPSASGAHPAITRPTHEISAIKRSRCAAVGPCVLGGRQYTYAQLVQHRHALLSTPCGAHLERHLADADMLERFGLPRAALDDMDAGEVAERRYAAGLTPSQLRVALL